MAINLETKTDEQLEQLRLDVLNEQEKRANRDGIPSQVADLAAKYVDAGGDPADLAAALPA